MYLRAALPCGPLAAPASGRMEGDRREAVVEDSLTAQAVLKSVPKAPEF